MTGSGDPRRHGRERDRAPGVPPHEPPPDERETDEVDEASRESFPSSDPPAYSGPAVGDDGEDR